MLEQEAVAGLPNVRIRRRTARCGQQNTRRQETLEMEKRRTQEGKNIQKITTPVARTKDILMPPNKM